MDLVINLALVFFVGNPIAVLLAGNLGYFVAMIAAVSAFLLLRRGPAGVATPHRS